MKITYINTRYWPAIGGGENLLRSIAKGLSEKYQVQVITIFNENRNDTVANVCVFAPAILPYSDNKIKVYSLNPSFLERLKASVSLFYYTPKFRRWFYEPLLEYSIKVFHATYRDKLKEIIRGSDIVHSFTAYHLGYSCLKISKELNLPFVITPLIHPGQYGTEKINIDICKKADAVCALLETEKRFYIDSGIDKDKISIMGSLPNIGRPKFKEELIKKYNLENKNVITFLGRKAAYKGIKELQQAAKIVFRKFPDSVLFLIGPHEKDTFILKDNRIIDIPSFSDVDYKTSFIALSDVICLPSKYEILPTVILEAWAFKKAVVASDIENHKCLIEDKKDGLLVEPTAEKIADALARIIMDSDFKKRLGEAGWQKLMDRYAQEKILSKITELYIRLKKSNKQ